VTVEDAGYTLAEALEPDDQRPLALEIVAPADPSAGGLPARVTVAVAPILDHNGHPVPDGTVVRFTTEPPDALAGEQVHAETVGGAVQVDLVFPRGGRVMVSAATTTGGAVSRAPLVLDLPVPTPMPTPLASPAPPGGGSAGAAGWMGLGAGWGGGGSRRLDLSDLLLALAPVVLIGAGIATSRRWRRRGLEGQLRTALLVAAGGLIGYLGLGIALAAGRAGSSWWAGGLGAVGAAWGGSLGGLAAGWWATGPNPPPSKGPADRGGPTAATAPAPPEAA